MPSSKLQRQVSNFLNENTGYLIKENYRPDWLISDRGTRLELDFYIEEIKLAVEVQGEQHFIYVEHFHGSPEGFKQRLVDDRYKKDYCEKHGIRLLEISEESDIQSLVGIIFPSRIHKGTKHQVPIRKQHKHFDKPLRGFQHISKKRSSSSPSSSKQIKFDALVDRLHNWMKGTMELSDIPHKKFFKHGLHKFLEEYQRFSREQDRSPEFLKFLEVNFPEYKTDFYIVKEFFKEQDKSFHLSQ